jgi:hypothetical protein
MTSVSTYSGEVTILRRDPHRIGVIRGEGRNRTISAVAEAGWYNDEEDPRRARWFDGAAWTEHTVDKEEWVGLGQPPSPEGERPLRPYRPIPDPKRFPMPQGSWIILTAVVLVIVAVLLVATRA